VTHNLELARVADRMFEMRDGGISETTVRPTGGQ